MKQLWNSITSFCKNAWDKLKAWWNEDSNPVRVQYEKFKALVVKSVGGFGWATLFICAGVIIFIMLTGGGAVLSVLGISIATIAGAFIAIQRFPWLEAFVLKYFAYLDLALFVFMFLAATTIFGLQVAAITGITSTISLILWKTWKDNADEAIKAFSESDFVEEIREAINTPSMTLNVA